MRRPFASVALSLLLTATLVVPTIAADPSPSARRAHDPTPSADRRPRPDRAPDPSRPPSPTGEPADPAPTRRGHALPGPGPERNRRRPTPPLHRPTPAAEPSRAAEPSPTTKPKAKPTTSEPATDKDGRPIAAGRYIVILSGTADTAGVISRHGKRDGIKADRKFERVRAFSAKLDAGQRKRPPVRSECRRGRPR